MGAIENNTHLTFFHHQDLGQIRVIIKNEEPLFCLSDICKVLELTNSSMVKESISEKRRQI